MTGANMFAKLQALLNNIFFNFQTTFIWLFIIGILICGMMLWIGSDENAPKFKKSLIFCITGLLVFLMAKPIIQYVQIYIK